MPDNRSEQVRVIIPVYNEEASLPKVIADLPREMISEIIIVDNASTDSSAEIARSLECVVVSEKRRGYGQACLAGIAALPETTDIVVFIDGDYSDHGDQLPLLLGPIQNNEAHMIIGSRALGQREKGAMTPQAFYGNKLACFLMRLFWGAEYTDLGPFRAIRYDSLQKLKMTDTNFGWTIEMQIKAFQNKLKVKEVPVDYRKRVGQSKISGTVMGTILAGEKIIRTIFKYKFFDK